MKQLVSLLISLLLIAVTLVGCSGSPLSANPAVEGIQLTTITSGRFHEYPLPQTGNGLMRPVIDQNGDIWFGEMEYNHLSVFSPHNALLQQIPIPEGANGIMGLTVAPDNTIWFAEQYGNFIGHYTPTTREFQRYPLTLLEHNKQQLPSAPNSLAVDQQGNIWFTELNADMIGVLNPRTGAIKQYALTEHKTVQQYAPYSLTIDKQGVVWFTLSNKPLLGRLDPPTGKVTLIEIPEKQNRLMEITHDAEGAIWATGFEQGLVLKYKPTTQQFAVYRAAHEPKRANGVYGILSQQNGDIWVVSTSENAIAQLKHGEQQFRYYRIPTASSMPLGLVEGPDGTFWFTETGGNRIASFKP
ncbi:streptogramin lyase [Thermosporothrix hazakensis]|uniref:Streptogramin lyase n=1 Tax=Thermosporothrix hazakensis TaxID=644383 RepID=A0A326U1V4_THEHA|nr:hypothetical protein [Thermosporothrix hazakensis]PZW22413.1 streptogramin lyase [Thermosporothrix hazakensis]GCE49167.1 hypothetical protein KTH_40360 [Thermosporothrix hazakensis]